MPGTPDKVRSGVIEDHVDPPSIRGGCAAGRDGARSMHAGSVTSPSATTFPSTSIERPSRSVSPRCET